MACCGYDSFCCGVFKCNICVLCSALPSARSTLPAQTKNKFTVGTRKKLLKMNVNKMHLKTKGTRS